MKKLSVAFCIVGLLLFCAAPVFAQTDVDTLSKRVDKLENAIGAWSLYGSARMATFWTDKNKEAGDDAELGHDLQSNSRIGGTVKRGNLGGQFEFGVDDTAGFSLRMLYGTYNFGPDFQILVGQTYTPTFTWISNQVFNEDINLYQFAPGYNGRRPMIQFKYDGLKVALVKNHAMKVLTGAPAGAETDMYFPKIEASYTLATQAFWFTVYGGYQTYKLDSATKDFDVDAYLVGLTAGVTMGPAYIRGGVMYSGNPGAYGILTQSTYTASNYPVIEGNAIKDTKALGASLVAGVKVSDMIAFEAGAAYITESSDRTGYGKDDKTMAAYLQSTITIAKGFTVTPEIGYYDYKKSLTGADQGNMWYAGLKTQIDF